MDGSDIHTCNEVMMAGWSSKCHQYLNQQESDYQTWVDCCMLMTGHGVGIKGTV